MAEWSTADVNDLPDASFLFVESGGEKDEEGKTKPRSLRHFPYKDKHGKVDPAHAQNAIARIPQSNAPGLSADKKQALQDKARRLLGIDTEKAVTMGAREQLSTIQSMLASIVGTQKCEVMKAAEFVPYAFDQITKAMSEPQPKSTARLKALLDAVTVFKDNYVDEESEGVKVTVYIPDTTALEEKSNTLKTPIQAAGSNPDGQSAFEQGFVQKFQALKGDLDAILAKLGEDIAEDDDSVKAKKAKDAEEEEKRKAAAKAKDDGETEPDAEKAAKAKADAAKAKADAEEEEKKKAAAKAAGGDVAKQDVSADGTAWPSNLNDPAFVEKGDVTKSLEWGADTK